MESFRAASRFVAVMAVFFVPNVAAAQVIEQIVGNASALFGRRQDGVRIGQGQSFYLPEPGTIWSAAFLFENSGQSDNGIPPGSDTDEIECSLRTPDGAAMLGAVVTNGFSNFVAGTRKQNWLCFPFSLALPAGDYVITCENRAASQYGFIANTNDASYLFGTRYVGYNSTWTPSVWDAVFRIRYLTAQSESNEVGPVASLAATPSIGLAPFNAEFQVNVAVALQGVTYSFWPNCAVPSTDLAAVIQDCGAPTQRITTTDASVKFAHTYLVDGEYMGKVIIQAGCSAPSEARTTILVPRPRRRAAKAFR